MKSFFQSVFVAAILTLTRESISLDIEIINTIFNFIVSKSSETSFQIAQEHLKFLKIFIAFTFLAFICAVVLFLIHILKPIVKRSKFVQKKKEISSRVSKIYNRHNHRLTHLQQQNIKLNEPIESVWLEDICSDVKELLSSAYGGDYFRVGVFAKIAYDDTSTGPQLVEVATCRVQTIMHQRTKFDTDKGFCGHAFQSETFKCGAYRRGWFGFLRKNRMYAPTNITGETQNKKRSFLSIPIHVNVPNSPNDKVVGVLCLDSKKKSHFLTENKDVLFLKSKLRENITYVIGRHIADKRYGNT